MTSAQRENIARAFDGIGAIYLPFFEEWKYTGAHYVAVTPTGTITPESAAFIVQEMLGALKAGGSVEHLEWMEIYDGVVLIGFAGK